MVIALKAPNGKILNLDYFLSGTGGAGPTTGFVNTVISSTGTAALSSGTGTYSSTFKADANNTAAGGPTGFAPTGTTWTQLYSTPNGNWTLGMYDGGGGDVGTLTSWSLSFNYLYGPPASGVWTPNGAGNGLYTDPAATILYTGAPANTVYAKPAATTTYSVTVTSVGPPATPTFANTAPIAINDGTTGTPYPATIAVTGVPATGVTVTNVKLNGVSHTWSSDIAIDLQSPAGTNVVLMAGVGGASALSNVNYTFTDAGAAMTTGANPTGTYKPTSLGGTHTFPAPGPGGLAQTGQTLASFTAGALNGTWKLFVVDEVFGDFGSINGGYSISFSYATVGCVSNATLVTVTVNTPLTFNGALPADAVVCTDKVTSFTAAASGSVVNHNWRVSTNNGNNWSDVVDGGVYAGAKTTTLTITAPPVSMTTYLYKDSVSTTACRDSSSRIAKLIVNPLPTIVISASPYQKLFPGLTTTLFSTVSPIAATGGYTWLKNGVAVPNATASSLLVNADGLGVYTLRVTDVNGCTNTSNAVSLTDSISGKLFVYPNPNNGVFQVRYYSIINNTNLPRGLNIYDSRGKKIAAKNYSINAPYARMDVDLRNYGSGVYWVEVVDVAGNRLAIGRAEVLR
jgi:subtilisin-like proprotein convertase family protein